MPRHLYHSDDMKCLKYRNFRSYSPSCPAQLWQKLELVTANVKDRVSLLIKLGEEWRDALCFPCINISVSRHQEQVHFYGVIGL